MSGMREDEVELMDDTLPLERDDDGMLIVDEEHRDDFGPPSFWEVIRSQITKKRTCIIITFSVICVVVILIIGSVVPSVVLTAPRRHQGESPSTSGTGSSNDEESSSSNEATSYTSEYSTIPDDFVPFVVPDPPDPNDEFIRNSAEFQITLENNSDWINRNYMVLQFTEQCNQLNEYLNISLADGNEAVRIQYKLLTGGSSKCYNNREIRVREYKAGEKSGTSYVDIKSNSHDRSKACDVPFWPAQNYYNQSRQKCERDVHQCDDKYSHETRVFFDDIHTMTTCYDLLLVYPWAFDELPPEEQYHSVEVDDLNPWWTSVFKGQMDGDTNYEIAFTLRYDDLEQAIAGYIEAPKYGEWSIRIYSLDDGASEFWNDDVVEATQSMWLQLSDIFGNRDNFGDCQ